MRFLNADAALQACRDQMPDAIAVDYMMPGLNGLDFVRQFRQLPQADAVPIIMITATMERQIKREALDLGVADFLTKPIDPFETRARLKNALALRRSYLEQRDRGRWLAEEVRKATDAVREHERGQQLALRISDAASRSNSVNKAFEYALGELCSYMGWQEGAAAFIENGSLQAPSVFYGNGAVGANMANPAAVLDGVALAREAFRSGTAQWAHGPVWRCAFPVALATDVVAVLQFASAAPVVIDESHRNIIAQAGMQLSRVMERARNEAQLVYNATHDSLTSLPNRVLFADRLQQAIAVAQRDPTVGFAVLIIDLDRFKVVNDSLGHLAGDDLLVKVAARLRHGLRGSDTVSSCTASGEGDTTLARVGGDEFTILLRGMSGPADAMRVADRIQRALQAPFTIAGQQVYTAASIGIALSSTGYDSSEAVLRDADLALYRAKALGKNRSEVFNLAMHEAAMARLTLEAELRRALQCGEFQLLYQPIVLLASRRIVGAEALVRWRRNSGELMSPGRFLQVAEETGLIVPLGEWIMREACQTLCVWNGALQDRPNLNISVNVSPRQFHHPGFVDQVARVLQETGVEPRRVQLEITESTTMGDGQQSEALPSELKALGVQLSVDDFGTGFSSLSYLHRFPLNVLKIDRSFVSGVVESAESRGIISSIIDLARNLGLEVVAEGAEDLAQVAELRRLGCDLVQGFFFYRPLDSSAVRQLLLEGGTHEALRCERTEPVA